jgi:hypothetical protein
MSAQRLTAARVRELLDCDPSTGTLRWRERPGNPSFNAQWAGRIAGKIDPSNGYLRLMIHGSALLRAPDCLAAHEGLAPEAGS